jgi:hypothetical protein
MVEFVFFMSVSFRYGAPVTHGIAFSRPSRRAPALLPAPCVARAAANSQIINIYMMLRYSK